MGNHTLEKINNVMEHGGETALDGLGMIPGLNVVTETAEAGLATANMYDRAMDGDFWGAAKSGGSAAFHGAAAALNAVSGEGGEALELAKEAFESAHIGKTIADTAGSVEDIVTGGVPIAPAAKRGMNNVSYVDAARAGMQHHHALNAVGGHH